MSIPRRHVEALVPGGVPDLESRTQLVAELLSAGDEQPEIDPEALGDIILKAARALWADGIYIGLEMDPSMLAAQKVTEIDKLIRELESQHAKAEAMTTRDAQNEGLEEPAFYRGATAALEDLRERIAGERRPVDVSF